VTPDSGNTVLRSRLGRNYRQLPTSGRWREPPAVPKSSTYRIQRCGIPFWPWDFFLSQPLSFRRLLLVDWRPGVHSPRCRSKGIGLAFDDRLSAFACSRGAFSAVPAESVW